MITVKANTKRGEKLLASASKWDGDDLKQVYNKFSKAKAEAYDDCADMCIATTDGDLKKAGFSITCHNSFGFCVSWCSNDGNVHYVTPKNHYLIVF